MHAKPTALLLTALLAALSANAAEAPPLPHSCPSGLPAGTRCLAGTDSAGAHYLIAQPARWSGVLVLHAHGGPELGAPRLARTEQDLQRWAVVLKAGHAWAGSTYRQGGVALQAAAEDTERLRGIARAALGDGLTRTLLHGQSWGASVAAVAAERFASAGPVGTRPYDGVLLSSGVLAGGSRAYDVRLDLRVVYQQLCHNHPLPSEPAYPLNIGLPPGSALTRAELARRADSCLGLNTPAQRSSAQQARLDTLLAVTRIPEATLMGHLNWATWHFQEVAQRLGGASPFGNAGVRYQGSADDEALNRSVARYTADAAARARFSADTDPTGRIAVPVLTVHGVDDGVAFVEMDAQWRQTMAAAGSAAQLVQTFTAHSSHSYLSDATYLTLLAALLQWVDGGAAPTPQAVAQRCPAMAGPAADGKGALGATGATGATDATGAMGAAVGAACRFLPDFTPKPLASRVPAR